MSPFNPIRHHEKHTSEDSQLCFARAASPHQQRERALSANNRPARYCNASKTGLKSLFARFMSNGRLGQTSGELLLKNSTARNRSGSSTQPRSNFAPSNLRCISTRSCSTFFARFPATLAHVNRRCQGWVQFSFLCFFILNSPDNIKLLQPKRHALKKETVAQCPHQDSDQTTPQPRPFSRCWSVRHSSQCPAAQRVGHLPTRFCVMKQKRNSGGWACRW